MVAEFHVINDGFVDVPAELFRAKGQVMIALYPRAGGNPWEFPLADFLRAVGEGLAVLGV